MTQSSYQELRKQLAVLEDEVAAAREEELAAVIAEVRQKVAEYGLTEADVFGRKRRRPSPVTAKYRDPTTGEEWSGRGRAPKWISAVKNRNRFLIEK
ncbi:H-NS family nucleoid-associated regulatory protein [Pandoraea sp. NPDC090278]|uniref:H-NS histone family protein n=1 Tax=Pandoraea sp. NPDC090278 TaxID=3364391 RepID=UPI00383BA073